MSEDKPIHIELSHKYEPDMDVQAPAQEFSQTEEFNEFIQQIIENLEQGASLTHAIAHVVMTLFEPGFVIIGSPNCTKLPDGTMAPRSLGISIAGDSEFTINDLGLTLLELGNTMLEDRNFEELLTDE